MEDRWGSEALTSGCAERSMPLPILIEHQETSHTASLLHHNISFFDNMATYGNIWQHMATYGNIWQHMATYGNIWQHMATYGNIWQHMATYGNIWQHMATIQPGSHIFSSVMRFPRFIVQKKSARNQLPSDAGSEVPTAHQKTCRACHGSAAGLPIKLWELRFAARKETPLVIKLVAIEHPFLIGKSWKII